MPTYLPTFETAETHLADLGDGLGPAARILRLWRPYAETGATPRAVTASSKPAVARVDLTRWLADCPHRCGNAQVVAWTDRRFFCVACENGGSGRWAPVAWPDDELVEAAELILIQRPLRNRFFDPAAETVGDLATENDWQGFPSNLPDRLERRITRPPMPASVVDDAALTGRRADKLDRLAPRKKRR